MKKCKIKRMKQKKTKKWKKKKNIVPCIPILSEDTKKIKSKKEDNWIYKSKCIRRIPKNKSGPSVVLIVKMARRKVKRKHAHYSILSIPINSRHSFSLEYLPTPS